MRQSFKWIETCKDLNKGQRSRALGIICWNDDIFRWLSCWIPCLSCYLIACNRCCNDMLVCWHCNARKNKKKSLFTSSFLTIIESLESMMQSSFPDSWRNMPMCIFPLHFLKYNFIFVNSNEANSLNMLKKRIFFNFTVQTEIIKQV